MKEGISLTDMNYRLFVTTQFNSQTVSYLVVYRVCCIDIKLSLSQLMHV